MPITKFEVASYRISLGDRLRASFGDITVTARGIVSCRGKKCEFLAAYFLTDDSPVPDAYVRDNAMYGAVFFKKELIGAWTDLLRNEKPIYGYLDSDHPETTQIYTGHEPIGEGEV